MILINNFSSQNYPFLFFTRINKCKQHNNKIKNIKLDICLLQNKENIKTKILHTEGKIMTNTTTLNNNFEAFELSMDELENINGGWWNPIEWLEDKLIKPKAERSAWFVAQQMQLLVGLNTFEDFYRYYKNNKQKYDLLIMAAIRSTSLGNISAAAVFAYVEIHIEWYMKMVYEIIHKY